LKERTAHERNPAVKLERDHECALAGVAKRLDARCGLGDMGSAMAGVLSRHRLGASECLQRPLCGNRCTNMPQRKAHPLGHRKTVSALRIVVIGAAPGSLRGL
jgi:hypothetical protein